MKQNFLMILFLGLYTLSINAQESINAKLVDSTSQKNIAFATIALNNTYGVISNENGRFQIQIKTKKSIKDSLFISCLGYETKRMAVDKFTDSIIFLNPKSIELGEVLLSNKKYSVEEIIEKTKENLNANYNFDFIKSKLFYRESYFTNILKNDIILDKSTIPEFNQNFIDSLLRIMPKKADNYTEILGTLYGKSIPDNLHKLQIIKASELYDKNNEITFEGLEERFNTIVKKYVKRDSYFKIKSGIFGTKENIDSSFFETEKEKETVAFVEEQKKRELEKKQNFLKYRKQTISNLEKDSFIFENSDLNFLEKSKKYNFELLGYIYLNDNFVYKITFTPKRSADFKGTLYISTEDFAIVRLDYENVKPLKTFNLLGISVNEHLKKGTLIYSKSTSNKYVLKFVETQHGIKIGIKRPLKIIEKNKNVKGRRKQNEISGNIHFIVSNITKKELVIFESENITEQIFNGYTEESKTDPIYLPKYDPEFWKGYNVIEPNQAIKNFKSIE